MYEHPVEGQTLSNPVVALRVLEIALETSVSSEARQGLLYRIHSAAPCGGSIVGVERRIPRAGNVDR